jgi:alpha-ketoglutarate-dependent taurine dioxygenase
VTITSRVELDVVRLTPYAGAEIRGVDVSRPLDPAIKDQIWSLLLEYHAVFLPEQHLDHEQHLAFARQFGDLAPSHPVLIAPLDENHPEVYVLDTRTGSGKVPRWHADVTYMPTPPAASFINVLELPPVGGDTLFASNEAAYESLSPSLRNFVDDLWAIHDSSGWGSDHFRDLLRQGAVGEWDGQPVTKMEPVVHPVVRVHPETGRRGLYIDPAATISILGLRQHESDALLSLLIEHLTRPEHVLRYRWQKGSVGIWDQRATLHYAVDDYGDQTRVVHRVSIRGDRPFGPNERPAT